MNEDIVLSKLSDECSKCKDKDNCNDKRMAACTAMIMPLTNTLSQPMLRQYTPIVINMGRYGSVDTSLEDIKEKINNEISNAFKIDCAFTR